MTAVGRTEQQHPREGEVRCGDAARGGTERDHMVVRDNSVQAASGSLWGLWAAGEGLLLIFKALGSL